MRKVIALLSIVAILSLSAPGLFAGETNYFRFTRILKRPAMLLYSIIYYAPIYNIGKYISPVATDDNQVKKVKLSGAFWWA